MNKVGYNYHMFSDPVKNIGYLDIKDGMAVADIGAGSGYYTVEVARKVGSNGRVYAIDVQKDILDRVKNNAATLGIRNIEIVLANAEKIGGTKLRENCVDRIVASNILFQIDQKDDFVLEMRRILKPGGKVLIIDWASSNPAGEKHLVTKDMATGLMNKGHFKLEKEFDAGDHHYGLVFIKE